MKQRCYYKKHVHYDRYGARGIEICDEWKSNFVSFRDWANKNGYKDNLSIDRIDNNGNYCPSNCRWSTVNEQGRNKVDNVSYKGETATEASIRLGGCGVLVHKRIENGWSLEKAFTTPKLSFKQAGKNASITRWGK